MKVEAQLMVVGLLVFLMNLISWLKQQFKMRMVF
jgi:hypothetical protein